MVYSDIICGLTVCLRAVEESDAETTYKMRSDPEKTRYVHRSTGTVLDQLAYIKKQRKIPGDYLFIVEDLSGKPIGMKGVYNYNEKERTCETGRFIGYGTQVQNIEALKLSFDFAFDVLNVEKIYMAALEDNSVMLGIQKRFGVEFIGRELVEDIGQYNICSVLTRDAYLISKVRVETLIKRFANR